MYQHVGVVYVCSNPRCGTVWAEDPHGHCPQCLVQRPDGHVGWSCGARQVLAIVKPSDLVPPRWPITGAVGATLEDAHAKVEGLTGGTPQ